MSNKTQRYISKFYKTKNKSTQYYILKMEIKRIMKISETKIWKK